MTAHYPKLRIPTASATTTLLETVAPLQDGLEDARKSSRQQAPDTAAPLALPGIGKTEIWAVEAGDTKSFETGFPITTTPRKWPGQLLEHSIGQNNWENIKLTKILTNDLSWISVSKQILGLSSFSQADTSS